MRFLLVALLLCGCATTPQGEREPYRTSVRVSYIGLGQVSVYSSLTPQTRLGTVQSGQSGCFRLRENQTMVLLARKLGENNLYASPIITTDRSWRWDLDENLHFSVYNLIPEPPCRRGQ